jgi:RNA polymerase-binding protein DksA
MNEKDLKRFERILRGQRDEVRAEVSSIQDTNLHRSLRDDSGEISGYSTHMADMASDEEALAMNLRILATEENILEQLDQAIDKIERGTYGTCESCRKPIGKARLTALPFARLCIDCRQHKEAGR